MNHFLSVNHNNSKRYYTLECKMELHEFAEPVRISKKVSDKDDSCVQMKIGHFFANTTEN